MTRFGCQKPSQSVVCSYELTDGADAIEGYNSSGRTAQPWQEQLVYDILATDDEGFYIHGRFGWSVPRRNGKGEIITIVEMDNLIRGRKVMHTAHRTTTSSAASYRLADLLKKRGYTEVQRVKNPEEHPKSFIFSKQFGLEKLVLLDSGGEVCFRTRTSTGGLGEGYDLLIIDEAQEYTKDQQNTLQYIVTDSINPQILMCGTPPTLISKGTVFTEYRNLCLSGESENSGWYEWSVEHKSDVDDVELWYQCNPAMGYQLNERKIKMEDKSDELDYNIQRLGLWVRYNQASAFTEKEWNELLSEKPSITNPLFIGVKFGKQNVSVGIATRVDDKIFVEALDCQSIRSGINWITGLIRDIKPQEIVVDGASGQGLMKDELKECGIRCVVLPTVKEVISAYSTFEQGIFKGTIIHGEQPSLAQAVGNCEKRAIGSSGGFGFRALKDGIDITLLDAVALAHYSCISSKPKKKKQRISY